MEKAKSRKLLVEYVIVGVVSLILSGIIFILSGGRSIFFAVECFALLAFFLKIALCQKDRFDPMSFFLLSLFLGFVDIVFAVLRVRAVGRLYDIGVYEKSLFLMILWLAFFCLTYELWMKLKSSKGHKKKETKSFLSSIKKVNINLVLVVGLVAQIFVFYKVITTIIAVGGFSEAINNFAIFKFNDQNYLLVFIYLLSFVPPALYEKGYKKTALLALILNFAIITLTGRRGIAITTVVISALVYVHYRVKPITNKVIALILLPIIAFILIVGSFRGQNVSLNSRNGVVLDTIAKVTNTVQYGDNVPDMIDKVDSGAVDFQGGKYIFNGIIGVIPRAIWSEKPEVDHSSISSQLVYNGQYSYGRPVGAFGFSYLCFGYIGVIVSGLICGLLTALFYCWAVKREQTVFSVLIYAIAIQFIMAITNPESQTKVIFIFAVMVITKVLDILLAKKIRKGKDEKPEQ